MMEKASQPSEKQTEIEPEADTPVGWGRSTACSKMTRIKKTAGVGQEASICTPRGQASVMAGLMLFL